MRTVANPRLKLGLKEPRFKRALSNLFCVNALFPHFGSFACDDMTRRNLMKFGASRRRSRAAATMPKGALTRPPLTDLVTDERIGNGIIA